MFPVLSIDSTMLRDAENRVATGPPNFTIVRMGGLNGIIPGPDRDHAWWIFHCGVRVSIASTIDAYLATGPVEQFVATIASVTDVAIANSINFLNASAFWVMPADLLMVETNGLAAGATITLIVQMIEVDLRAFGPRQRRNVRNIVERPT